MSKLFTLRKAKTTSFRAAAADGDLCLEMYDVIGADFFGDGTTAQSVSDALANAGVYNSITVRLNSPGGDLFEGVAIYNVLKAAKKPINVVVDGLAASAASLIAMAGDKVTMGTGAMMMVHEAIAMTAGYANDHRKMAGTLDTVTASAADLYVEKTGMKKADVLALMAAETWMSAQECVDKGFANAISDDEAAIGNAFDLSVFKNVPAKLKAEAKTKEVDGEALTAGDFIYVGDPDKVDTWALPWHFSTEEKTQSHLRDALSRWDQEEKIPESEKPAARAKLERLCKEHGVDVSDKKAKNDASDVVVTMLAKRLEILKQRN